MTSQCLLVTYFLPNYSRRGGSAVRVHLPRLFFSVYCATAVWRGDCSLDFIILSFSLELDRPLSYRTSAASRNVTSPAQGSPRGSAKSLRALSHTSLILCMSSNSILLAFLDGGTCLALPSTSSRRAKVLSHRFFLVNCVESYITRQWRHSFT